jgi:hypothetical protein
LALPVYPEMQPGEVEQVSALIAAFYRKGE